MASRNVRLNITMERKLYQRLKKVLPSKKISSFIAEAVKARLQPDRLELDAAYRAASREPWRRGLSRDWKHTETESWPD
jgi:hypothetical protein